MGQGITAGEGGGMTEFEQAVADALWQFMRQSVALRPDPSEVSDGDFDAITRGYADFLAPRVAAAIEIAVGEEHYGDWQRVALVALRGDGP